MADFGRGWSGIRRRESEIPLKRVQRRTRPNRINNKGIGHEIDAGERRVRSFVRQRPGDLLGWKRQHIGDRDIFRQNGRDARRKWAVRRRLAEVIGVETDDAAVGCRSLRPVDPPALECELLGWVAL